MHSFILCLTITTAEMGCFNIIWAHLTFSFQQVGATNVPRPQGLDPDADAFIRASSDQQIILRAKGLGLSRKVWD